MQLRTQTWPDAAAQLEATSVALVPIGSTEQHGPHLPLATDHLIAEALAKTAADRTDVICTPALRIGVSAHHRQFPGTLWVDPPAFRSFVESFTRNLTYHGIDRVVYVNAHGGNVAPLREVGRRLHEDEAAFAVEWMWDESIPALVDDLFEQTGPHGGPKETAMIMHIAEELVKSNELTTARDTGLPTVSRSTGRINGARVFYDAIENSDNGVFGDQTDATPEKGRRLFAAAADQLVNLVEWLENQSFETLMPADRQHSSQLLP